MNCSPQTKVPAINVDLAKGKARVGEERRILKWLLKIPELALKTILGSVYCLQTLAIYCH